MAIIIGTDGNDRYNDPVYPGNVELKGTNGDDQMYGLAGNDDLVGFDGNDTLVGGAGADQLYGQGGFDFASYQGSPEGVYILLSYADGTDFGDASGDRLYDIEGVIGSDHGDFFQGTAETNVLRGGSGDDVASGLDGNDTLQGEAGDDWLEGGAGDDLLSGGAGGDTASFNAGVVADLATGTAQGSYTGSDRLVGIENLYGSGGDDRLAGGKRGNVLTGGGGADLLEGRAGADRFAYGQSYESRAGTADRILDFSHKQGDLIDLAAVDADAQSVGEQAFTFIGQNQFTGVGQVRFHQQGGDTFIEANTSEATAGPEMVIVLDPLVSLQGADFLL